VDTEELIMVPLIGDAAMATTEKGVLTTESTTKEESLTPEMILTHSVNYRFSQRKQPSA